MLQSVKFCTNIFGNILPEDVSEEDIKVKGQSTRKVIAQEYAEGLRMFGSDPVNGFVVELETGKLGLVKV